MHDSPLRAPDTPVNTTPSQSGGVLLFDGNSYTAELLRETITRFGFEDVTVASGPLELSAVLKARRVDVVVLNFHFEQSGSLAACSVVKQHDARLPVLVLSAPGPARRQVKDWQEQTGSVDRLIEKPLIDNRLNNTLVEVLATRASARHVADQAERIRSMVPEGMLDAALALDHPEAELVQMAVLFTDLRHSSQIAESASARDFFSRINESLSAQAALVHQNQGFVVKYTGDGLIAGFRGLARCHHALRCALHIARLDKKGERPGGFRIGQGLNEGLVMAGFVGGSELRQYDLLGATVHLAARLCSRARAGETLVSGDAYLSARIDVPGAVAVGATRVRGFKRPIDCLSIGGRQRRARPTTQPRGHL
jgi:adenylate cyclase